MEVCGTDDGLSAFVGARSRIFGIARRMLGSAAEAEDIVQEVWLRWQRADRSVVRDPPAFLVTTATRLAINQVQSARSRHETPVGPWHSEPMDPTADPGLGAERREALEQAISLLLEALSPKERAAYVLREAFNYPYPKVAEILRCNEACCRQLVARARKHIADGRRSPVAARQQSRLLDAFRKAARNGDLADLEGVLASETTPPSQEHGTGRDLAKTGFKSGVLASQGPDRYLGIMAMTE
jgi:RNA polymerase sigma-70 factor (ECF subfamily)